MTDLQQYAPGPDSTVQFFRLWSAHVDGLERHLSAKTWALAVATVVLIAYPIARILMPAMLHAVVPDAVRTVLNLI
ncbi:MAG: hypothetical protein WAN60_04880 [Candidatus Sulfotelmatobacter sp.]